ncbi:aldo/keto reductase [Roseococcus sp. YIM B11640]|uniref:aldo/keto reductase n=1 Tax=Roseococcus sp. YIM B11640 TaxID=3133973 RepID=UPI003C7AB920
MSVPILTTKHMAMPALGLGTWPMKGAECQAAVESALGLGYRHIDTAEMYGNEDAVGAALAAADVPRGEIFLTTKIWWDKPDGPSFRAGFEQSLQRLRQPYVNLLLIHWPSPQLDLPSVLTEMARLQEAGLARAVGVSNFPPGLLKQALAHKIAELSCIQVEQHAMLGQDRILALAGEAGMVTTSYTPLGKGEMLEDEVITGIADRLDATPAQVALAWLLAKPMVAAIPKAQGPERQRENLGAAEIQLSEADIAAIDALPKNRRFVNPSFAPDWAA